MENKYHRGWFLGWASVNINWTCTHNFGEQWWPIDEDGSLGIKRLGWPAEKKRVNKGWLCEYYF